MSLEDLAGRLRAAYVTPHVRRGHDFYHVQRVAAMGPAIRRHIVFDINEFNWSAWLHNVDRCEALKAEIQHAGGLREYFFVLLADSGFSLDAKMRIIDAVLQHPKKDDEPGDSSLLTALRVADKLDRFNASTVLEGGASWGHLPIFDARNPFGYDSAEPNEHGTAGHQSIYQTFYRVMEWIPMLPADWARELIAPGDLRLHITLLRRLGIQAAAQFGVRNAVEDDLRHALGSYYDWTMAYIS